MLGGEKGGRIFRGRSKEEGVVEKCWEARKEEGFFEEGGRIFRGRSKEEGGRRNVHSIEKEIKK